MTDATEPHKIRAAQNNKYHQVQTTKHLRVLEFLRYFE
jgi:hypothetical protein